MHVPMLSLICSSHLEVEGGENTPFLLCACVVRFQLDLAAVNFEEPKKILCFLVLSSLTTTVRCVSITTAVLRFVICIGFIYFMLSSRYGKIEYSNPSSTISGEAAGSAARILPDFHR